MWLLIAGEIHCTINNFEVRLKKSYDYFKTLKDMSDYVKSAFFNVMSGDGLRKEIIAFSGTRNELSDNLIKEFVAPIERNDIYKLSFCLNDELQRIAQISEYMSLVDTHFRDSFWQIGDLFNKQNEILSAFSDLRAPQKALRFVRESYALSGKVKNETLKCAKNSLQSAAQPLLKYAVASAFSELVRSVERTFCEVERIIINNN